MASIKEVIRAKSVTCKGCQAAAIFGCMKGVSSDEIVAMATNRQSCDLKLTKTGATR